MADLPEVMFYHVEGASVHETLRPLIVKSLERDWRVLVVCPDADTRQSLDDALWTAESGDFIAHGRSDEPEAHRQPVLISDTPDNQNDAAIAFLLNGAERPEPLGWQRWCVVFDGASQSDVSDARKLWSALKADTYTLSYWQRSPEGKWQKKA